MERLDLNYWEVVTREVYKFRPFSEEVIALRLGARRRSTGLCVYGLQGCEPFIPRRGVSYIECARTPAPLRYAGFNAHKGKAVPVTSTVKCHKCS